MEGQPAVGDLAAEAASRPVEHRPRNLDSCPGRRGRSVCNARLLEREGIPRDGLAARSDELAGQGRTSVQVAIDGEAAAVIAIADAPRETAAEAISALRELAVRPVMLSGDSQATAQRVAAALGIGEVSAEVLPADKAAKVTELQQEGRNVAMVGAVALKRLRLPDRAQRDQTPPAAGAPGGHGQHIPAADAA